MPQPLDIAPATGKLGVLTPGLGAVASTFIAGVIAARQGLTVPIGSVSQMAHVRLGDREDDRNPLIREFVDLASLDDLVFGAWDPISPNALGALGSRPERVQDRFSSAYQIALASQAIADLASLRSGAAAAGQALATLSLEVDVRFADAERRSAFAQELSEAVAALARKYHDENASGGRTFKLYLGCYPKVTAPG